MDEERAVNSINWHIRGTETRILVNLEQQETLQKQERELNRDLDALINELMKHTKKENDK